LISDLKFEQAHNSGALGIAVESPQGGTTEDLKRKARPRFGSLSDQRGNAQNSEH